MKRIYQAANNVEAHMIVHLLDQTGIRAHVEGEHLQSGAGELPLGNLVAVAVADEDIEAARRVIRDWEAQTAPSADSAQPAPAKTSAYRPVLTFLIGALVGGGIIWLAYNGPENEQGSDRNEDGKVDERAFYSSDRLERIEMDRDFDGRMDAIQEFGRDTLPRAYRSDEDFDGRMETTVFYRRGQPEEGRADLDGDGQIDYRDKYRYGTIESSEYLHPQSGAVAKRVTYRGSKADRAQLDLDGDGQWERSYRFDRFDEPVEE